MAKTIFIATAEPYSGKSIIALGILNMLLGKARKVGYFKPIINEDPEVKKEGDIEMILIFKYTHCLRRYLCLYPPESNKADGNRKKRGSD